MGLAGSCQQHCCHASGTADGLVATLVLLTCPQAAAAGLLYQWLLSVCIVGTWAHDQPVLLLLHHPYQSLTLYHLQSRLPTASAVGCQRKSLVCCWLGLQNPLHSCQCQAPHQQCWMYLSMTGHLQTSPCCLLEAIQAKSPGVLAHERMVMTRCTGVPGLPSLLHTAAWRPAASDWAYLCCC